MTHCIAEVCRKAGYIFEKSVYSEVYRSGNGCLERFYILSLDEGLSTKLALGRRSLARSFSKWRKFPRMHRRAIVHVS